MTKRMKRIGIAVLCTLALAGMTACGKSYVCEACEEQFSGDAFYGMSGRDVMCEDCARSYWMPLDYTNFQWKAGSVPDTTKESRGNDYDGSPKGAVQTPQSDEAAPDPEELRAEQIRTQVAAVEEKLSEFDMIGDIVGALDYLNEQMELLEITFDASDEGLEQLRDGYREQYLQQALAKAKDVYEAEGYEAAIHLLNTAQAQLGPDNERLAEAVEYYRQMGPVYLAELDYFDREECGFQLCEKMVEDNLGNAHTAVLGASDGNAYNGPEMTWQTYKLGAKYTKFSGCCYLRFSDRASKKSSGTFQFYGDGTLLFDSGSIEPGDEPVSFALDVTGVDELKIVLSAVQRGTIIGTMGATGFYQIGDALLER